MEDRNTKYRDEQSRDSKAREVVGGPKRSRTRGCQGNETSGRCVHNPCARHSRQKTGPPPKPARSCGKHPEHICTRGSQNLLLEPVSQVHKGDLLPSRVPLLLLVSRVGPAGRRV